MYDFDTHYISEKLTPPQIRGDKFIAWLRVILEPIQSVWYNIFNDYAIGSTYSVYDVSSAYVKWDKVVYQNKSVYMCILNTGIGINCDNTTYWIKINDNFIGCSERVLYNSQKITFEYALNKWFLVAYSLPWTGANHTNQIYIENNDVAGSQMVMGATGTYSSPLAASGVYSLTAMGATYTAVGNDFTIYVPTAVWTTLGSTNPDRENTIRIFADKYNLAGIIYNVTNY